MHPLGNKSHKLWVLLRLLILLLVSFGNGTAVLCTPSVPESTSTESFVSSSIGTRMSTLDTNLSKIKLTTSVSLVQSFVVGHFVGELAHSILTCLRFGLGSGGVSKSQDTPPFSFYRYRELFYSHPSILAIMNLQGCTEMTSHAGSDMHYCSSLYVTYEHTLCEPERRHFAASLGNAPFESDVLDSICKGGVCLCYAPSDTFLDVHFEHLCKKGQDSAEHRFMGQWGQDRFLLENIFAHLPAESHRQRVYVDIGHGARSCVATPVVQAIPCKL
eukprot:6466441-Amphidinium_carterae.1